jgi:GMP synthase (glutamine-hydrolysing)
MILIVDCGSKSMINLYDLLKKARKRFKIVKLDNLPEISGLNYQGVIIGGAPILLTEANKKEYVKNFRFIKESDKPVLGICFGHQIIGLLYGSKIFKGNEVRRSQKIQIVKKEPLFSGIKCSSFFLEDHIEHITLPKKFFLIADSETCENEAMKHKSKNIYGVQFHPEVSGKPGKVLINNFLKLCNK